MKNRMMTFITSYEKRDLHSNEEFGVFGRNLDHEKNLDKNVFQRIFHSGGTTGNEYVSYVFQNNRSEKCRRLEVFNYTGYYILARKFNLSIWYSPVPIS